MTGSSCDIVAIGNALVDIMCEVNDEVLHEFDLEKGAMHLCSHEQQHALLQRATSPIYVPGGSAANTAASLAALGITTAFMGCVGDDNHGHIFTTSMTDSGVHTYTEIIEGPIATGTSAILVTPDRERTMNTHLGAACEITSSTLVEPVIAAARIVYIEGYAYDRPDEKAAVTQAIELAHENNRSVALTLSDTHCVQRHREDFCNLVPRIDITCGNEQEFLALFSSPEDRITPELLLEHEDRCSPLCVITRGEDGCLLLQDGVVLEVPSVTPATIVDVTGAGDQFMAGFLYGLSTGHTAHESAQIGAVLATRVIETLGPRISSPVLADLARQLSTYPR